MDEVFKYFLNFVKKIYQLLLMAEYLPNVRFNRRGHVNSQHESSTWFAWTYTLESLRPPEFIVNGNYGAMTVLRDSFRKYIINTPIQNTTLGIEILYTDHPHEIKPKRIFIVKFSRCNFIELI